MTAKARSARGTVVDFDPLSIKQQLATKPVPVGVSARRQFIDEKDGLKIKESFIVHPVIDEDSPFALAQEAMNASAASEASEQS